MTDLDQATDARVRQAIWLLRQNGFTINPPGNGAQNRETIALAALLDEVLATFGERGHPGAPCRRSYWIDETIIRRWHATLHVNR